MVAWICAMLLPHSQVTHSQLITEGGRRHVRRTILALVFLIAAVAAQTALASQVISTSTVTGLKLGVNDKGQALVTYKAAGKDVELLAFGAVNAIPPKAGGKQVEFTLDYSGG